MAGLGARTARFLRSTRNRKVAIRESGDNAAPPLPVMQTALSRRGLQALALAGRALDPNAPDGPDWALGRLLLREAFLSAARALCRDASIDDVEAAAAALARRNEASGDSPREARARDALEALGRVVVPDGATMTRAQIEVAQLVDEAVGNHRIARATRRVRVVFALLASAVAAVTAVALSASRRPWEEYTWSASSTWDGFPQSGTLGDHGAHDLLFHTDEQENPWVVVDLRTTRAVRDVQVTNRADCCDDRGLPLVLELAEDDRRFNPIDTRTAPFDVWRVTFAPRRARYLRLRAIGMTFLHLCDIEIR
jgi:hypothetical protein